MRSDSVAVPAGRLSAEQQSHVAMERWCAFGAATSEELASALRKDHRGSRPICADDEEAARVLAWRLPASEGMDSRRRLRVRVEPRHINLA